MKKITIAVRLSNERLVREFFIMQSIATPACLCILEALSIFVLFHTHWTTSSFDNWSNIPSHANTIKSSSPFILNSIISGVAITTLESPPYFLNYAMWSPIVLDTDNFPGNILCCPIIFLFPGT